MLLKAYRCFECLSVLLNACLCLEMLSCATQNYTYNTLAAYNITQRNDSQLFLLKMSYFTHERHSRVYHVAACPAEKIDTGRGQSVTASRAPTHCRCGPSAYWPVLLGSPVLPVHYLSVIVARLDFATASSDLA